MQHIDVFNGDADGICALVQLRLAQPRQSQLITGIKRDINLLRSVEAESGDHITVLDISFEKNIKDIVRLLANGSSIEYFDHHKIGDLVKHDKLVTDINLAANTCTALIVDKRLKGKYRAWALTAAFGDNLSETARSLGLESGFSEADLSVLEKLGILLNYNGYGASIDDLFFHPAELFEKLRSFTTPFDFLEQDKTTFKTLANGYQRDMTLASQASYIHQTEDVAVIQLPNKKWSRRVSGVFSNELANNNPDRAHAVLMNKQDGTYLVSIRAPLNKKFGADELASQFTTGGGRKAAAGINNLPADMLTKFIDTFELQYT